MTIDPALPRLLQLASPSLPIGQFGYSQGLESAVESGWVTDADGTRDWLEGLIENVLARVDMPIAARLYDAWMRGDCERAGSWSERLLACRETAELRAEDRQTGRALAKLLADLGLAEAEPWLRAERTTLAAMFTLAAARWRIAKHDALAGLLWSWLENQVLCAIKLVPLGQAAGQRLLFELGAGIPAWVELASTLGDADIGGSAFGQALASSRHEVQYCRLFRS
ncbi:MAG: urease accessory protein UreF [Gammaproteobacteria bacterium]